jgi:hypothetical protein
MNDSNKAGKIRGKLPVKKSINLAEVGQKKTRVSTALLAIILILLVAAAISKFFVMDRFAEVAREQQKVRDLRNELSAANAKLDSFGELKETYAHYTFSDMTAEEMRRVERSDVVELIERVVLPAAELNSWNVKQNQLTLNVTLDTLQDTNMLAQILNEEDMVEFATVKNAVTNELEKEEEPVASEEGVEGAEKGTPAEDVPPEEAPSEEAPAEETEGQEQPDEGEGEVEGEGEAKELLYNVTAQIIVYLTNVEKEG